MRAGVLFAVAPQGQALGCLGQALADKGTLVLGLKVDLTYDRLHGELRFQALLKKLGLDPCAPLRHVSLR